MPHAASRRPERIVLSALVALYLVTVTHAAWLSDDAFIAFRAAANAVDGFGLLSNPPERVQAFTSPLATIVFLVGFSVVREAYAVGIAVGLIASTVTAWLVAFRLDAPTPARALALVLMTLSAAMVDFSTSGLENPISHLLIVLFSAWGLGGLSNTNASWRFARRALLLVGLIGLSRLDLLLLVLPTVMALLVRHRAERIWPPLLAGLAPLATWELFAIVYYGFPYPNTAYAKLNVHIPREVLVERGFAYLVESWRRDPLTLGVIASALCVSILRTSKAALPIAAGALAYLGYVVWVGGDFMSGRFLTAPFMACLVALCSLLPAKHRTYYALGFACLAAYALLAPLAPFRSRDTRCVVPPSGIVDERACYEEHTALRYQLDEAKYRTHDYYRRGLAMRHRAPLVTSGTLVGMTGYAAGPHVHIVDHYALTDPLLSHRPFAGGRWRVGHFYRPAPEGYLESIRAGENRVEDPVARAELDEVWTVVRGPLFSSDRWAAIWRLNLDP